MTGAASAGLLIAALAAGCAATVSYQATPDTCYAFAVQAIQRRVIVVGEPRACAGLSQEQVNLAVARAINEQAGARPKAIARRLARQDAVYLAHLIGAVPPSEPAPPSEPVAPTAAPARPSAGLPLNLAALAAWVLTATAGAYMLAGWLGRWLAARGWRRRPRVPDAGTAFTVGHFGLALTGLAIWIGFLATGLGLLAWIAVAMVVVIAGLGMAVLAAALPEPSQSAAPAGRSGPPVVVIAVHGMLATLTILLVVLAAIGTR
jgi:manganese efflux pump family protein